MTAPRVCTVLLGLPLIAGSVTAQLVEERVCPQTVCFVTDRGKVVPLEDPVERYDDKRWLQIRYESSGRPRLSIAPAVSNVRDVSSSTDSYGGDDTSTHTAQEPILPIGGLEDLLIEALLKTKLFDVVERLEIDRVYEEQDIAAAKGEGLSSLTPGQYIAIATVSELAETQRAATRGVKTALGRIGLGRDKSKVVVGVRIVDVKTGKVVFTTLENAAVSGWSGRVKEDKEPGSEEEQQETEFASSGLISTAVSCALNKAAFKVAQWAVSIPWWSVVIKVQEEEPNVFVYFAGGRQQGVESGMQLAVWSEGEPLTLPGSDEILGYDRIRMGTAIVQDVREQFSIAKFVEGNSSIEVGHKVELMAARSDKP